MDLEKSNSKTIIFNKEKFPKVEVIFNSITNEVEYNMFEESWIDLYKEEKKFYFIFEMADITNVHTKYISKIVTFIKFIKLI